MDQPLISVIVPVYNVEQYLNKCIQSITDQTYHNLEIILVDDGSTDSCSDICDEWEKKDNRIKVIHKRNGGLSDARNEGLKNVTGEYISFIDSDDWIELKFYEMLYSALIKNTADIAACEYLRIAEGKFGEAERQSICKEVVTDRTESMEKLIENQIQQVVWNKLYKAAVVRNVTFAVGKYHEDEYWTYQVMGKIDRMVSISYVGYYYLQRKNSIMGEGYSRKRLDAVFAKCERQEYLNRYFPNLADQGRRNLIFTCMYHGQNALLYLKESEQKEVLSILQSIVKEQKPRLSDRGSGKEKMWMRMANRNLSRTCRLRNKLKIGF